MQNKKLIFFFITLCSCSQFSKHNQLIIGLSHNDVILKLGEPMKKMPNYDSRLQLIGEEWTYYNYGYKNFYVVFNNNTADRIKPQERHNC